MIRSLWGPNATEDDCSGRLKVSYRRLPKGAWGDAACGGLVLLGPAGLADCILHSSHPTACVRTVLRSSLLQPSPNAGERAVFQPRSAAFQQEVGEDIRGVLEAALLQVRTPVFFFQCRLLLAVVFPPLA